MKHPDADPLSYSDISDATERIAGRVRPVTVTPAERVEKPGASGEYDLHFALEYMQYTGSFKARGAQNFLRAHHAAGMLPDAGVTIASGGNTGLACAWAAQELGVASTVFLPTTAPTVKIECLRSYDVDVQLVGSEYAEANAACQDFAATSGALTSHAYDNPLIAAGAGTLVDDIRTHVPDIDTIVVAVGGGGLFAGVATAADHHGIQTVAVEPDGSAVLNASLAAGKLIDIPVNSIAADSLGARRASQYALHATQLESSSSITVSDGDIIRARANLWKDRRIAVEYGAATALAALEGAYVPSVGEKVCVVLCGANTDPTTL